MDDVGLGIAREVPSISELLDAAAIPAERVGVQRFALLNATEREFYQWILRRLGNDDPPTLAELTERANTVDGLSIDEMLDHFETLDLIRRDPQSNEITVAYPFSLKATAHEVRMDRGANVFAMCAIDALAIPLVLARDALVRSRDPVSDELIEVRVSSTGEASWMPEATVVLAARRGDDFSVIADSCCQVTNFFASTDSAKRYLAEHANVSGVVASVPEALAAGQALFGSALEAR